MNNTDSPQHQLGKIILTKKARNYILSLRDLYEDDGLSSKPFVCALMVFGKCVECYASTYPTFERFSKSDMVELYDRDVRILAGDGVGDFGYPVGFPFAIGVDEKEGFVRLVPRSFDDMKQIYREVSNEESLSYSVDAHYDAVEVLARLGSINFFRDLHFLSQYLGRPVKEDVLPQLEVCLRWFDNQKPDKDLCYQILGLAHLNGWIVEPNLEKALETFNANNKCCVGQSKEQFVLRWLLGDGLEYSPAKATQTLQDFTQTDGISPLISEVLPRLLQQGKWNPDVETRRIIPYFERAGFADAHKIIELATPHQKKQLGYLLRVKNQLLRANLMPHTVMAPWYSTLLLTNLAEQRHSPAQLQKATAAVGPIYNVLDVSGFPLPSVIGPEFYKPNGFNKISGLNWDGLRLKVDGKRNTPKELPLVLEEDIQCAMALVFGCGDKPILPSLSLEQPTQGWEGREVQFYKKVFEPEWLANTAFGQSLYWSDYLMKQLSHGCAWVSLTDPFYHATMASERTMPELLKKIAYCGGKTTEHGGFEITLYSVSGSSNKQNGLVQMVINKVVHGVSGSETETDHNGAETRGLNTMNINTYAGRAATLMTNHYSEIAEMFPVFERVRQLQVLTRSLIWAKENGMRPSQKEITSLREFVAKMEKIKPECLLVPIPFKPNSPTEIGGVSMRNAEATFTPQTDGQAHRTEVNTESQKERREMYGNLADELHPVNKTLGENQDILLAQPISVCWDARPDIPVNECWIMKVDPYITPPAGTDTNFPDALDGVLGVGVPIVAGASVRLAGEGIKSLKDFFDRQRKG